MRNQGDLCLKPIFSIWVPGGPLLDTCIRIEEDNQIRYKYFEKTTCSKKSLHSKSAINENSKNEILSNYTVRRLLTKEELGAEYKGAIV